jgi:hypothetical protein
VKHEKRFRERNYRPFFQQQYAAALRGAGRQSIASCLEKSIVSSLSLDCVQKHSLALIIVASFSAFTLIQLDGFSSISEEKFSLSAGDIFYYIVLSLKGKAKMSRSYENNLLSAAGFFIHAVASPPSIYFHSNSINQQRILNFIAHQILIEINHCG